MNAKEDTIEYLNELKPIDFGEAGRVLKSDDDIIVTTGLSDGVSFSAYVVSCKGFKKGYATHTWFCDVAWQDITDTYKPETDGK